MHANYLKIENFMGVTSAEINLAQRGLVLIQGVNLDDSSAGSNGAGKSSMFDGFSWCLEGVTARGESGDAVINDKVGKNCRVETELCDDGHLYKIARHRKHKQGKNGLTVHHLAPTLGATWQDLTKGTDKLTQEVVDKILGCSLEVFVGSIYAGQEKMPDLPGMTDKQLKVLIEEAAGVTVLEEAYGIARRRADEAKILAKATDEKIDRVIVQKDNDEANLEMAQSQVDVWETKRTDEVAAQTTLARELMAKIKTHDALMAKQPDAAELVKQIAEVEEKIDGVDHENTTLSEHNTLAANATAKANSLAVQIRLHASKVRSAQEMVKGVHDRVGCPCEECGREITVNEIKSAEESAKNKLLDNAADYRKAKKELEDAQNDAEKLTSERDAFKASMTDISESTKLRRDLQEKLNGVRSLQTEREQMVTRARTHAERAKELKAEKNPHSEAVDRFKEKIAEHDELLTAFSEEKVKTDLALDEANAVVKVFSPAGVRALILDEVTPFLNQRTAHYLGILSDGNIQATWTTLVANAKGELKEKFSIEVENERGGKRFGLQSGGEKRKVRIACALALQDLVATRANKPINLFIADEIDHALDDAGLERLMQVLEEKAGERGTVMVISHNSLRDWIPNVIEVEKKDGETTLREVSA